MRSKREGGERQTIEKSELWFINDCSPPPRPSPAHHSQLKLPIGNHWNTWQCREGSFDTRYPDSSKQSLQLRYMSGEHTLEQRPGDNPATYENGQIAFYSNGQSAVLARPASATVLLTGCRP